MANTGRNNLCVIPLGATTDLKGRPISDLPVLVRTFQEIYTCTVFCDALTSVVFRAVAGSRGRELFPSDRMPKVAAPFLSVSLSSLWFTPPPAAPCCWKLLCPWKLGPQYVSQGACNVSPFALARGSKEFAWIRRDVSFAEIFAIHLQDALLYLPTAIGEI